MQKWEYRVPVIEWGWVGKFPRIQSVDGKELRDWRQSGPSIQEYCNQLGDEGWELVDNSGIHYVFKRPKP